MNFEKNAPETLNSRKSGECLQKRSKSKTEMRKLISVGLGIFALIALGNGNYFAFFVLMILVVWLFQKKPKRKPDLGEAVPENQINYLNPPSHNQYFSIMGKILYYEKKRKYEKMLACVEKTIPLLNDFVVDCKKAYGRFDIGRIPAIDIGCRYWAALGKRDKLKRLKKTINKIPELKPFNIDSAFGDADLADAIKAHIKKYPGTEQNKLGKEIKASGRDVARLIKTLENLGIIYRKKSGKTYQVFLKKRWTFF